MTVCWSWLSFNRLSSNRSSAKYFTTQPISPDTSLIVQKYIKRLLANPFLYQFYSPAFIILYFLLIISHNLRLFTPAFWFHYCTVYYIFMALKAPVICWWALRNLLTQFCVWRATSETEFHPSQTGADRGVVLPLPVCTRFVRTAACQLETPSTVPRIGPCGERMLRSPRPYVDDDEQECSLWL